MTTTGKTIRVNTEKNLKSRDCKLGLMQQRKKTTKNTLKIIDKRRDACKCERSQQGRSGRTKWKEWINQRRAYQGSVTEDEFLG